jgi:uncharacterized Zn finger protein
MAKNRWNEWDYGDYRPTIKVQGGIKAQTKRGQFGASWWAKRWIEVLESFDLGTRLGRGRAYARKGQVLAVDIATGMVKAKVQGSSRKPYDVTIKVKLLPETDWKKLAAALTSQAIFAAKLLAGEMPQEIEQIFATVGLSLFPEKLRDLQTSCSCPDWSNPCKHIAAVYYLLGEEFDRDPFLIFKLRGRGREEFVESLGSSGSPKRKPATRAKPQTVRAARALSEPKVEQAAGRGKRSKPARASASAVPPSEPLAPDVANFWSGAALPEDFFGAVNLPRVIAALPRRLGNFPFWRGEQAFFEALDEIYRQSSPRGLEAFMGLRPKP